MQHSYLGCPLEHFFSHSRSEHFWKQNTILGHTITFFSNHVNIRLNSQNSGSPCVHSTERKNATPLFFTTFMQLYGALICMTSCQTASFYCCDFWSHQQLQLITILHEITRYEKFRNDSFFSPISLFFFIDDYTKFVQQMTPGRFMTRKNAIKTFYVQLRALSTIPKQASTIYNTSKTADTGPRHHQYLKLLKIGTYLWETKASLIQLIRNIEPKLDFKSRTI